MQSIWALMGKLYIKVKNDDWGQINWIFVGNMIGLKNIERKCSNSPYGLLCIITKFDYAE